MTSFGLFVITFFIVSITPGMCMILALSMGMTIGHIRTLWMILGELIGVSLVVIICGFGVGSLMIKYTSSFTILKYCGGLYLLYLSIQLWLSKGTLAIPINDKAQTQIIKKKNYYSLISQGFFTAVFNPKGWAFFIALLPPFLSQQNPLLPQILILLIGILLIEFISLNLYSFGGQLIGGIISKENNVKIINRIAGTLMGFVALWLAFG